MTERNIGYIGNGEYTVYYSLPNIDSIRKFVGVCENFNPNALSAFWNQENETMLVVQYSDIRGLYSMKSN